MEIFKKRLYLEKTAGISRTQIEGEDGWIILKSGESQVTLR